MNVRPLIAAWVLLAACVTLVYACEAGAHEIRPAYLAIDEVAPGRFDVTWKQPSRGPLVLKLEPALSNGLLDSKPDEIYATDSFLIRRWSGRSASRDSFDGATIRIQGLERTLNDALVTITFADGTQLQRILQSDDPVWQIQLGSHPAGTFAGDYLVLGIEHILTGFDHLAFVLGLMMLVRRYMSLLKTITAFTVAHSITLAGAALGYVNVDSALIEALIALSIAFIAVEVLYSWRGRPSLTASRPWLIAFGFGLLHGFGFAGSLADIGLPPDNIPWSLLLFNIGVEIGQVLFVAFVLACVTLWRRARWDVSNRLRWVAPYSIGSLACFWMIERVAAFAQ
ncbi:MAG TPA: HupE/UreJ family protein [Steroidobacter sp.]